MSNVGDTIAIIGLVTGMGSGAWMAISKYGTIREQIYANKRDLLHANNNAKQAGKALTELDMRFDLLETELVEVRAIAMILLNNSGMTYSGILAHKPRGQNASSTRGDG
jgi:hypothetical protein